MRNGLVMRCFLALALTTFLIMPLVGIVAVAQSAEVIALYDYSGDGSITCRDDFKIEFPRTYTDEATEAMRRFPGELENLDRDDDGYGCDNQPDPVTVARLVDEAPAPRSTPRPNEPSPPRSSNSTSGCDSTLVSNGRVTICAGQGITGEE